MRKLEGGTGGSREEIAFDLKVSFLSRVKNSKACNKCISTTIFHVKIWYVLVNLRGQFSVHLNSWLYYITTEVFTRTCSYNPGYKFY